MFQIELTLRNINDKMNLIDIKQIISVILSGRQINILFLNVIFYAHSIQQNPSISLTELTCRVLLNVDHVTRNVLVS